MPNEYGVPTEQNDRLLELAGGCRHEWGSEKRSWRDMEWDTPVCLKCGVTQWWVTEDHITLPAVGDGHMMDLGEMVRLAIEIEDRLGGLVEVKFSCDEPGWCAVMHWYDGKRFHSIMGGPLRDNNTPEAALAAAIIAAVDGEKA